MGLTEPLFPLTQDHFEPSPDFDYWVPTERQSLALSLDIFEILYGGARGGGKTDCGIIWIAQPAICENATPKYRGLVLRENYQDLCDWIDRAWMIYEPLGFKMAGNPVTFRAPSGGVIRTGHLQDEKAIKKYQGHEYQRVLVEELTQIATYLRYLKLIMSCRSTCAVPPSVFLTANPGGPGHFWVKQRFIDPAPPETPIWDPEMGTWRIYIPALLADNPHLDTKDPNYRKRLEGLPDQVKQAWLFGNWNAIEGQYFREWDPAKHTYRPNFSIPKHWTRHVAIDWGYSPDPWAALFFAVDENDRVYVYHEMTGNEDLPATVAKKILDFLPADQISSAIGDPSMWAKKDSPDSTAIRMQNAGLYMLQPANNERIQGWTRIHEYLKGNMLAVSLGCKKLIEFIPLLEHDTKGNPEDAMDNSAIDHLPDALRYFLMSRPLAAEPKPPEKKFETRTDWVVAQQLRALRRRSSQRI